MSGRNSVGNNSSSLDGRRSFDGTDRLIRDMEARITSDSFGVQSLRESLSASLVRKTTLFFV
jgi:hypothetical protein